MSTTIFDRILAKEIPAQIVYEDDVVLAFKDINPQAKVHVLVVPKKKARSLAEVGQWDQVTTGAFFCAIARVAKELGVEGSGYRVVLNTGAHSCQSVDYVHAHILGGEQLHGSFGR